MYNNIRGGKDMDTFYSKTKEQVMEKLKSSENGISESEAQKRIKEYGYNEFEEKKGKTMLQRFAEQFKDF